MVLWWPRASKDRLARLLTPEYFHVQIKAPSGWLVSDVADLPPTLRTIKGCYFDFSPPVWRNVQSLDISCKSYAVAEQLIDLLIESTLKIKYVLLRFVFVTNFDTNQEEQSVFHAKMSKLISAIPQLRTLCAYVTISFTMQHFLVGGDCNRVIHHKLNLWDSKLVFLSAMQSAQSTDRASARSDLDADPIGRILSLVGKIPESFFYQDRNKEAECLLLYGLMLRTNEQLRPEVLPGAVTICTNVHVHIAGPFAGCPLETHF